MTRPLRHQFIDVAAIQSGEHEAFAQLFAQNRQRLLALAYRLTSSTAEAEDVVQDAFVSSLRHCDQFQGAAKPSTWLYRVTFNAALMRLRTRRRKGADSLDALPPAVAERAMGAHHFDDEMMAADDVTAAHERRAAVTNALSTLKPLDQELVRMRYLEDLSTEEVAERSGLTTSAVKTRLHRARAALRDTMTAANA